MESKRNGGEGAKERRRTGDDFLSLLFMYMRTHTQNTRGIQRIHHTTDSLLFFFFVSRI
ncbi:unnamed protein product, partial [Vitis vinifera]